MANALQRALILDEVALHLYGFLPGKAHPYGHQALSFAAVASELGVGAYWLGGSKRPAIRSLLDGVLTHRPDRFSPLLLKIVERAITHRRTSNPVSRQDIQKLIGLVSRLGRQLPELADPTFLASLPSDRKEADEATTRRLSGEAAQELQKRLMHIAQGEPQQRGFAFEAFLAELFSACGLAPRGSFRLRGEQIDGSFDMHQTTYLLEAKWHAGRVGQSDLLSFAGKVEGRPVWVRGLFVSYSGFSEDGLHAYGRGRATRILCMDGLDLSQVLAGGLDLSEVISRKARRASETNDAFVPVRELFPGVI